MGLCFVGSASADAAESLLTALLDRCTPSEKRSFLSLNLILFSRAAKRNRRLAVPRVAKAFCFRIWRRCTGAVEACLLVSAEGIPMPLGHFLSVGLGLVFLGTRDAAEGVLCAVAALPNAAFSSLAARTVEGLAAAGSGDVLKVQRMLGFSAESRGEGYWAQQQLELEKAQRCPDQTQEEEAGAESAAGAAGGGSSAAETSKKEANEKGDAAQPPPAAAGSSGVGDGGTASPEEKKGGSAGDSATRPSQTPQQSSGNPKPASAAGGEGAASSSSSASAAGTRSAAGQGASIEEDEDSSARENFDQAVAVLNIALVAFAEETGSDMALRLYVSPPARLAASQNPRAPLAPRLASRDFSPSRRCVFFRTIFYSTQTLRRSAPCRWLWRFSIPATPSPF